jgi:archaellum component FlaF (FlaF/FlaG flagellin family)
MNKETLVRAKEPDKGTAINNGALAAVVVLFALVIFQGVILVKMKQYNDDLQRCNEYWLHKTDSLSHENFKLYMQTYELKDSIITLRFER